MSIKYWSGKPTDPEHLNYTQMSYEEVFKNATWERPTPKQKIDNPKKRKEIEKVIKNESNEKS